ncbi:MAG: hypothetical protein GF341_02875 [candidate division Zixibacteria bacterium]|nr:hypothetical protein [candidate division Zixibacteria bacterium]
MAIDATLAGWCADGNLYAAVRFYQMSPSAVTIGRHQRFRSVLDEELLEQRGWEWSRRVTGGGALLHHRELNYAVALSKEAIQAHGPFGFQTAFRMIMSGFRHGLESVGCQPMLYMGGAEVNGAPRASAHGLCEHSLTRYEITIDDRKAVAAAQLMLPNACLQHGTLYLQAPQPEDRFWPEIGDDAEYSRWWDTTSVSSVDSRAPETLEAALKSGLTEHLSVALCAWTPDRDFDTAVGDQMGEWEADGYHRRR